MADSNIRPLPNHTSMNCVATTVYDLDGAKAETTVREGYNGTSRKAIKNNYFRSAEWTADGTSIITNSADNYVRTFIIPPDLLDKRDEPLSLTAYSGVQSAEPINSVVSYPLFHLQEPSTALLLLSIRDHPIRLHSALTPNLVGSYPLTNPTTEAFISPHSLLFAAQGSRFVAGSDNLLSIFDLSRPGQGPVSWLPTSRKKGSRLVDSGMSMNGIISALALEESSGILAAGTFSRNIGLYGSAGQGDCVGVFNVKGTEADQHIGGRGVTQVIWSPCGRYLYVVERRSDGAMIYDIRQTGQLLGWLEGRKAVTNQRLGVQVASIAEHSCQEVWGGGTDGTIRAWWDPHRSEGAQQPDFEWKGHHAATSSVTVHPRGAVVASSSGERRYSNPDDSSSDSEAAQQDRFGTSEADNSLKIWAL